MLDRVPPPEPPKFQDDDLSEPLTDGTLLLPLDASTFSSRFGSDARSRYAGAGSRTRPDRREQFAYTAFVLCCVGHPDGVCGEHLLIEREHFFNGDRTLRRFVRLCNAVFHPAFIRCGGRPEISSRHHAKVYGKASVGSPPMSVPHLDTRHIEGKVSVLSDPAQASRQSFLSMDPIARKGKGA